MSEKVYYGGWWDVEPTTPKKPMVLSTTPFVNTHDTIEVHPLFSEARLLNVRSSFTLTKSVFFQEKSNVLPVETSHGPMLSCEKSIQQKQRNFDDFGGYEEPRCFEKKNQLNCYLRRSKRPYSYNV